MSYTILVYWHGLHPLDWSTRATYCQHLKNLSTKVSLTCVCVCVCVYMLVDQFDFHNPSYTHYQLWVCARYTCMHVYIHVYIHARTCVERVCLSASFVWNWYTRTSSSRLVKTEHRVSEIMVCCMCTCIQSIHACACIHACKAYIWISSSCPKIGT